MTEIVFELPDAKTPGFLRRSRQLAEYQDAVKQDGLGELAKFDLMVKFLSQFVKEPTDPQAVQDALMDATQEQINDLFALLTGKIGAVDPTNAGS